MSRRCFSYHIESHVAGYYHKGLSEGEKEMLRSCVRERERERSRVKTEDCEGRGCFRLFVASGHNTIYFSLSTSQPCGEIIFKCLLQVADIPYLYKGDHATVPYAMESEPRTARNDLFQEARDPFRSGHHSLTLNSSSPDVWN